jgi:hypothetical protein
MSLTNSGHIVVTLCQIIDDVIAPFSFYTLYTNEKND